MLRCLTVVTLVAACGGHSVNVERDAHAVPDAPEAVEDCGGFYENTCANGQSCFGSRACDAVWSCREEGPTCSAAGPTSVCGCDGRVGAVAAGCPERYAWTLSTYPYADFGAPCDASRTAPPTRVALRIEFRGFDDFATAHLAGQGIGALDVGLARGAAELVTGELLHDSSIYSIAVFVDAGEQRTCTDGVDRVGILQPTRFDALRIEAVYEVTPERLTSPCSAWRN